MKKILLFVLLMMLLATSFTFTTFASGGKEHGTIGSGCVHQEDPVGPGDQPDWQD